MTLTEKMIAAFTAILEDDSFARSEDVVAVKRKLDDQDVQRSLGKHAFHDCMLGEQGGRRTFLIVKEALAWAVLFRSGEFKPENNQEWMKVMNALRQNDTYQDFKSKCDSNYTSRKRRRLSRGGRDRTFDVYCVECATTWVATFQQIPEWFKEGEEGARAALLIRGRYSSCNVLGLQLTLPNTIPEFPQSMLPELEGIRFASPAELAPQTFEELKRIDQALQGGAQLISPKDDKQIQKLKRLLSIHMVDFLRLYQDKVRQSRQSWQDRVMTVRQNMTEQADASLQYLVQRERAEYTALLQEASVLGHSARTDLKQVASDPLDACMGALSSVDAYTQALQEAVGQDRQFEIMLKGLWRLAEKHAVNRQEGNDKFPNDILRTMLRCQNFKDMRVLVGMVKRAHESEESPLNIVGLKNRLVYNYQGSAVRDILMVLAHHGERLFLEVQFQHADLFTASREAMRTHRFFSSVRTALDLVGQ